MLAGGRLAHPDPLGKLADGQLPVQHQPKHGPAAGMGDRIDRCLRRARDIILGVDGRVTESVRWKTPTFAYHGNIASFNPSKHLLSIMFHRGTEIPGEHPRLEGEGRLVRTMRFAGLEQLEAGRADLEAAIRTWCDWKANSSKPG
jgi:hypothetical protein